MGGPRQRQDARGRADSACAGPDTSYQGLVGEGVRVVDPLGGAVHVSGLAGAPQRGNHFVIVLAAEQLGLAGVQGDPWGVVAIHLLVRHRHDRVLELLTKICDGLVDQEDGHSHEQQVDEDEQDREDVLQTGLAEADVAGGRLTVQS